MTLPSFEQLKAYLTEFGFTKSIFLVFFIWAHKVIFKSYEKRLEERQKEIDRLADDNRAYRERYLAFHDKKHNYKALSPAEAVL